ncbi:MAG: DUF5367 family protein [Candidatus Acidiferrales bacterium]
MNKRLFLVGMAIWIGATVALRLAGQRLLRPGDVTGTLILYAVSLPLMACIVRRLCRQLPCEQRVAGAVSVALPSLLLDLFSCAFFPFVFPNMAPEVAGVFGGWILWCCAGAIAGVVIPKWR